MTNYASISKKGAQIITAERPEERDDAAYMLARYALLTIWHKSPQKAAEQTRRLLSEFASMSSQ